MLRPILKWILLAAIITGCSSTSLVYNNADWLVRDRIDDYFALSGRQQQQLKSDIKTFFQWHRQQELVEYSTLLIEFNQQFSDGLSTQELDFFLDKLSAARIRFTETSIPSASAFLSTVSAHQVDNFDQAFRERQMEKAERLNLSLQEFKDENFDDLVDKLEDWFGDFDDNQLAQLRVISDARPDRRQYWYDQSELKHQQFSTLLRQKPGPEKIEQYLHNRYVTLNQSDEQTQAIRLQGRTYWRNTMLAIDRMITSKQRKQMMNKLADYASDFVTLSKQSDNRFRSGFEK